MAKADFKQMLTYLNRRFNSSFLFTAMYIRKMLSKINQISAVNSNQYYRNFINSCKSEATKNDYRKGLSYFMDYMSIEAENPCNILVPMKLANCQDLLFFALH
jgi:hypothetical protein